jgi:hypothetical protein
VVKHALIAMMLVACVKQAQQVMGPDPDQVGTYSCREIVENCDAQCGDPICFNKCTEEGTREAQPQHAALLDCAQRNSCMDRDCMEQNCPQEIQTCMGTTAEDPSQVPAQPADVSKESQTTSGQ